MFGNLLEEISEPWTEEVEALHDQEDLPVHAGPGKRTWSSSSGQRSGISASTTVDSEHLNSRMTFAAYVERKFVPDHVEHKTRAGRTHYQAMLKHMLRPERVNCIFENVHGTKKSLTSIPNWPYLDDVRLCDLTTIHVRKIILSATNHGYSAQTIKHIKTVIGAVVSHAQNEGCFSRPNPAAQVKLPPLTRTQRQELSARQVSQALGIMESPEREIALITMYTGLPLTTICNLRWKDVNLTLFPRTADGDRLPPISLRVNKDVRKGGSTTVDIPDPILPTLLDLRSRRVNADLNDFMLISSDGFQLSSADVRSGFKQIGVRLGIPGISWQDFRRIHKKFVLEFLLKPYSVWTAEGILSSSIRSTML